MVHEHDKLIQALTPTVMVPRFGAFEPLERPGHRFLVADDGLWLELRRSWLYARQRIAAQSQVAMPYGQLEPAITFLCPPIPAAFVQQFSALARRSCPQEAAGWIVWNEVTCEFAFREVEALSASAGHIRYHRPTLADGECLVMDWHSHGSSKAFFSGTDNRDDRGEVKVSGVLGCCDQERVDMALRLCLLGTFIKLNARVSGDRIVFEEAIPEHKGDSQSWSTSSGRAF
ncbi:MAG: hypothetical protein AzoDbin1_01872 [Azoarcus sp.]|nr:hypothetical protein [Azoarcus sp.]